MDRKREVVSSIQEQQVKPSHLDLQGSLVDVANMCFQSMPLA